MKKNIMSIMVVVVCLLSTSYAFAEPIMEVRKLNMDKQISMDFQNANLKDVLKIFSQQSGLNFVAGEDVQDKLITLYLDGVSVQDALDNIIMANKLIYKQLSGSNIFVVEPKKEETIEQSTITRVYRLKYARTSGSTLEKGAATAISELGSSSLSASSTSSSTGGSSGTESSSGGSGASSGERGIDMVIEEILSPKGSVVADERTNSLIITDVPEQFEKIEQVIAYLDVPTPQIMIELELLEVRLDVLDRLGPEWGGGSSGVDMMSYSGPSINTNYPFSRIEKTAGSAFDQTASSLTLGTLSATQLSFTLEMMETETDTKILARPRVLTLNNESAVIKITSNTAVATLSTVTASEGISSSSQNEAERVETGVSLKVTPQVNADDYVTMFIEPSVVVPTASEFFPSSFVDPQERSVKTTVRVRNGETVVIGGLIRSDKAVTNKKVTFLGDIPVLGYLFKNKDGDTEERELIIFITPHVMDADYAAEDYQTGYEANIEDSIIDDVLISTENKLSSEGLITKIEEKKETSEDSQRGKLDPKRGQEMDKVLDWLGK